MSEAVGPGHERFFGACHPGNLSASKEKDLSTSSRKLEQSSRTCIRKRFFTPFRMTGEELRMTESVIPVKAETYKPCPESDACSYRL